MGIEFDKLVQLTETKVEVDTLRKPKVEVTLLKNY